MYHVPEINGIRWNGMHSRLDLGAVCRSRSTPPPKPIKRHERVAYSNLTWDYSLLSGIREYENRTLRYQFSLTDSHWQRLRERVDAFTEWLYAPLGFEDLYDSAEPDYHFRAKLTSAVPEYQTPHCCEITVEFEAYPFRIPNGDLSYPVDPDYYPDIDGDGIVTAADVQMISTAAANIGAGEPSGLDEDQERRADADRDGTITASDAQLAADFVSAVGAGDFENDAAGWTHFLNESLGRKPEVI